MKRPMRFALVIIALLIVEGSVVAAALVSSDFRETAGEISSGAVDAINDTWVGTEDEPGYGPILGNAMLDAYRRWLVPLWSADAPSGGESEVFAACANCHVDFVQRDRFGDFYMDHPLHAATGLGCGDCHNDVAHPGPLPPAESVCEECHTEDTKTGGDCSLCHAPGSLPHYSLLGASRIGFVTCTTCHLPDTIGPGDHHFRNIRPDFDGTDLSECFACHQEKNCQRCHAVDHPDDWRQTHPSGIGPRGTEICVICHSIVWCSDACHAAAVQSIPLRPLVAEPSGGS